MEAILVPIPEDFLTKFHGEMEWRYTLHCIYKGEWKIGLLLTPAGGHLGEQWGGGWLGKGAQGRMVSRMNTCLTLGGRAERIYKIGTKHGQCRFLIQEAVWSVS